MGLLSKGASPTSISWLFASGKPDPWRAGCKDYFHSRGMFNAALLASWVPV